ncbi:hypothetical protein Tco_1456920 [Tanacetum coccineum]
MATLNESLPQGTDSDSGPMCQNTILGAQKLKLEKPEESNGFEGIIDFLNASSIRWYQSLVALDLGSTRCFMIEFMKKKRSIGDISASEGFVR